MNIYTNVLLFFLYWSTCLACDVPFTSILDLYDHLLSPYNKRIRPVKDQNSTVIVEAKYSPSMLLCLQTTGQYMSVNGHFELTWRDEFLVWNASDYHDVDSVTLTVKDIWYPVLAIAVARNKRSFVGEPVDKVFVSSDGTVYWSLEDVYTVVCEIDITYYPFDIQECQMTVYIADEWPKDVLLQPMQDGSQRAFSSENAEWKALDMDVRSSFVHGTYMIKYRFLFARRASFIMYTTVGPLILLAFLNSFVFLVPISSGEKGSIAITVLLSFSVYISSISSALPSNSLHTPLLFVFMTVLELHSALTVFVVILEARLHSSAFDSDTLKPCTCTKTECRRNISEEGNFEGRSEMRNKPTNAQSCSFRNADVVMFTLSLLCNLAVLFLIGLRVNDGLKTQL